VLSATSICSGRNARNVSSLFTCTSTDLVLLGEQRFMFIFGGEFYFMLVLFTIYYGFIVCPHSGYSSRGLLIKTDHPV
jgi:hypothetical protein